MGAMARGDEPQELGFIHEFKRGSAEWTLLLLHGTGGDEQDLLPLGIRLDPEANLVSPRGKVVEDGMPRFFRRLAPAVFDLEDLVARTHELASFMEEAVQAYGLNERKIVAVGFSNGANIAASLLLLRPKVLRAAALLHAMVPFQPERLPDLSGTSVLLTAGRRDSMIPQEAAEQLGRMLTDAGAELTLQWEPGGHQLTQTEVARTAEWLSGVESAG